MTSLNDVYDGEVGRVASRRQQVVGMGLFLAGAAGLVAAIAFATTPIGQRFELSEYAAREVAGTVAGLGLPAVILGVFTVLPSGRRTRAAAALGTSVAVLGVALFRSIYPYNWVESAPLLALGVSIVYSIGILAAFWALFAAVATFKTRNDPGGTARMEVTESGTIRLVEDARSVSSVGGVGLFGGEPDGDVETQTNRASQSAARSDGSGTTEHQPTSGGGGQSPDRPDSGPQRSEQRAGETREWDDRTDSTLDSDIAQAGPESTPTADGGTESVSSDPITDTAVHRGEPDTYCGNCRHFQYVMHDDDIVPYCGFHEKLMDDMDACSAWTNND
ncbi:DUF7139 domain-containing protein [Haloarcula sp. GH36]|uniref:DUF7139 domain-containing protein n=1 Tax=Haloarcula montana TaxID=3111776 RepID=UPI002D78FBED|nr:hypothetical protein [Haloarcula sp. GH36]